VTTHSITAVYNGDANFAGSRSSTVNIPVQVAGTVSAPLRWTFASTSSATKVLTLSMANAAPLGSAVLVTCHGGGCPYARYATSVKTAKVCQTHKHKHTCTSRNLLDLGSRFAKHRLHPGAKITVDVTRFGWTGRYYSFQIRSRRAPNVIQGCLPVGTLKPGAC
jgi:hypothetical protein